MNRRSVVCVMLLLLGCAASADAGRLYARKPMTASPLYNLRLDSVRSTVTIRNLLATTHVDETFYNPEPIDLEGFYVFQLPEGAIVDGLWMWVDGKRYTFGVRRKETAQQQYDSLVQHGYGDPALLQSLGSNRFQLRIYPIKANSTRRIEIQYFQLLPLNAQGRALFTYPMAIADYQTTPVRFTALRISLASDFALETIKTNHDSLLTAVSVTYADTSHATVDFGVESLQYTRDFTLTFAQRDWQNTFPVLNYSMPDTVADGFFILWTPPTEAFADMGAKADFVFALDASGSMTGLRINVVRETVEQLLGMLLPSDRFRIVLFSGATTSYPADTAMLFATTANVTSAITFLRSAYTPRGITDYGTGIRAALESAFRSAAERRLLFVTDGLPNRGPKTAAGLDSVLAPGGGSLARFYPLTMYTENVNILSEAARRNAGRLVSIEQADTIATVLRDLTFDFSSPSFSDVLLTLPTEAYHTYPRTFNASSTVNELHTTGRTVGSAVRDVRFRYKEPLHSVNQDITRPVPFTPDSLEPVQIARYWAAQRINDLLNDLRFVTDSTEIKESIIRLSERFNILTPFTAFIVVKIETPQDVDKGETVPPERIALRQNYPNPFNPTTLIEYFIPDAQRGQHMTLRVYDARGRLVRTLVDGAATPGLQRVLWDGRDEHGAALPSGVYYCVLRSGGQMRTITMTLAR
ncbi:MAG: VWA domain-containing protein [Ignavibacteriae bacterium]|nr:VWA domain-containing protein [Ignavibacteriota bacterium]